MDEWASINAKDQILIKVNTTYSDFTIKIICNNMRFRGNISKGINNINEKENCMYLVLSSHFIEGETPQYTRWDWESEKFHWFLGQDASTTSGLMLIHYERPSQSEKCKVSLIFEIKGIYNIWIGVGSQSDTRIVLENAKLCLIFKTSCIYNTWISVGTLWETRLFWEMQGFIVSLR